MYSYCARWPLPRTAELDSRLERILRAETDFYNGPRINAVFSPDGRQVVTTCSKKVSATLWWDKDCFEGGRTAHLWDLASGNEIDILGHHATVLIEPDTGNVI